VKGGQKSYIAAPPTSFPERSSKSICLSGVREETIRTRIIRGHLSAEVTLFEFAWWMGRNRKIEKVLMVTTFERGKGSPES